MWSLVSVLSGSSSDNPAIAVGEEQLVCAVWHSVVTGNDVIQSATQQIGGAWSSVKTLLTGSSNKLNYPSVAVNSNGTAMATWFRYTKTGSNYTNVYLLSSSFTGSSSSVPIEISNGGNRNPADLFNHLHMDSSGNTIAFWTQSYDSSNFDVETAIKPFGRIWAESAPLTTGNETAYKGDIATSSLKNALAAYMLLDGGETVIQAVESGISGVNNGTTFWTAPFRLSTGGQNGYPQLACAYNPNNSTLYTVAVWLNFNGMFNVVNGSLGSRTVLPPPPNLRITQGLNDFGVFKTYFNQIEWDPSPSGDVQQYAIYRDGIFLQTVDAGTTVFIDNNVQQNGAVTYGVSAVDAGFLESPVVNANFP